MTHSASFLSPAWLHVTLCADARLLLAPLGSTRLAPGTSRLHSASLGSARPAFGPFRPHSRLRSAHTCLASEPVESRNFSPSPWLVTQRSAGSGQAHLGLCRAQLGSTLHRAHLVPFFSRLRSSPARPCTCQLLTYRWSALGELVPGDPERVSQGLRHRGGLAD